MSPGVQLSPAAPAPLPLAVSGQSSSYQCYGQSSLSHQHTFTHGDQRGLPAARQTYHHVRVVVVVQRRYYSESYFVKSFTVPREGCVLSQCPNYTSTNHV